MVYWSERILYKYIEKKHLNCHEIHTSPLILKDSGYEAEKSRKVGTREKLGYKALAFSRLIPVLALLFFPALSK